MRNWILYHFSGRFPVRFIRKDDRPYLERYYIGTLMGVTFYLHRFVSSDEEAHVHNHPWGWGRALVLCGWYDEEYVEDLSAYTPNGVISKIRRVRFWNKVDGNWFHRIHRSKAGTWTLFFHGKRVPHKGWGFVDHGSVVGMSNAVVFRNYPHSPPSDWWKTAKPGRESDREPLL